MTTPQSASSAPPQADRLRVVMYSLALLIVAGGLAYYGYVRYVDRPTPINELQALQGLFVKAAQDQKLSNGYQDADGDLLADAPSDPSKLQTVEQIGFCLATDDDPQQLQEEWKDFVVALEEATGKKAIYRTDLGDAHLAALRDGRLQVAAFSTGNVPLAVNTAGFVPLAAPADAEGKYAYEMEIVVPANSSARSPADLKGKTIAFTTLSSNSGARRRW